MLYSMPHQPPGNSRFSRPWHTSKVFLTALKMSDAPANNYDQADIARTDSNYRWIFMGLCLSLVCVKI